MLRERLRPLLASPSPDDAFCGVVLVTQGDATLVEEAAGLANRTWAVPNTPDTLFATASVTKTFTAVVVLQLVDEGRISLDQPIRSIVPLDGTAIGDGVTVRHLLTHTSGVADYFPEDEDAWPAVFERVPTYTIRRVADLLPLFVDAAPRFPPGARHAYSNAGYVLLGRAVEVVSGREYGDVLTARVLRPAGMTRACLPTIDAVVADLADPHALVPDGVGGRRWIRCLTTALPPAPDGGLVASARELDGFWDALLGGRLLEPATVERMLSPHATVGDGRAYGFGVHLTMGPTGVQRFGAHGFDHGVNAFTTHHPDPGVTVTVLSNVDVGAVAAHRLLSAAVTEQGRH